MTQQRKTLVELIALHLFLKNCLKVSDFLYLPVIYYLYLFYIFTCKNIFRNYF